MARASFVPSSIQFDMVDASTFGRDGVLYVPGLTTLLGDYVVQTGLGREDVSVSILLTSEEAAEVRRIVQQASDRHRAHMAEILGDDR